MSTGLVRTKKAVPTRRVRSGPTAPSIREVSVVGLAREARPGDWRNGASVSWMGRSYRINDQDERYLHLGLADLRRTRTTEGF